MRIVLVDTEGDVLFSGTSALDLRLPAAGRGGKRPRSTRTEEQAPAALGEPYEAEDAPDDEHSGVFPLSTR